MIAAELRGGSKPSLNEALGWIGSRVDDIYGAAVGRLEDVWIDPGSGEPRWLLIQKGGLGGHSTLIPFEDANAGAGHVWIPYERDVVTEAPEVDPAAPLTQQAEAQLRRHYVMYATRGGAMHAATPAPPPAPPQAGPEAPSTPPHGEDQPPPLTPPPAPPRPPAPEASSGPGYQAPAPASRLQQPPQGSPEPAQPAAPRSEPSRPSAPSVSHPATSNGTRAPSSGEPLDRPYRVEIELRGGIRISGELTGLRLTPIDDGDDT